MQDGRYLNNDTTYHMGSVWVHIKLLSMSEGHFCYLLGGYHLKKKLENMPDIYGEIIAQDFHP